MTRPAATGAGTVLARAELERFAAATGTPLPWRPAPEAGPDRGPVPPEVASALEVLGSPDLLLDLEVSVRRPASPSGLAQLCSWHRLRGQRVATLSVAGTTGVELACFDIACWGAQLRRAVTVAPPAAGPPPARGVDLPHELLLGGCAALRLGRPDLLAELATRHGGGVRLSPERAAGAVAVPDHVRRLAGSAGRMRVTVATRPPGGPRIGWLTWVLYADGWRSLAPYVRDGVPMVRVRAVSPGDLGTAVGRLLMAVPR